MKKIKVLILPSDMYGVGLYRLMWPTQMMQKNHSDEIEITVKYQQDVTPEDMDKYDIVHFNRLFPSKNGSKTIEGFQAAGCKVVMDIDDYWLPPQGHPLHNLTKNRGSHKQAFAGIIASDHVTTTTEEFAKILRKHNDSVTVFPNSIDFNQAMWQNKRKPSDKLRIGWIGGSSHAVDLDKLKGVFNRLYNDPELKGKFEIVMCGFDTRGSMTTTHPTTGQEHTRKIKPEDTIWLKFEEIFNDYGRAPQDVYVRRNTLVINRYGEHYNFIDVALAPLVDTKFNACKSELKAIEAGAMSCVFIGSDVPSYNKIIEHGVNGLLVPAKKDHKLWAKYIKQLILDRDMVERLSGALHEDVYHDFNLVNVTDERVQFYKEITLSEK